MAQRVWRPLLEGELAEKAWAAIRAIAGEIPAYPLEPGKVSSEAWGLASGAAGTAVFYAYLAAATGDEGCEERALADLEGALDCAAAQPWRLGLWPGLLGATWSYDHLAGRLFAAEEEGEAPENDGDALLLEALGGAQENYDLIQGLAGFGIACLEGLPRAGARRGLERVLDHLLASAEPLGPGLGWYTPPELLPPWQAELAPEGYYNLGVAHGMPAVLVLLARAIAAGIRAAELRPLLEGTVAYLLAQRGPEGFPSWVPRRGPAPPAARLAWCYGDPGIAASLLAASEALGRPDWAAIAFGVARQAAARDLELAGIKDCGICHGAAGLAHIWNRLWQASGDPGLAEAARYWFGQALAMRRQDAGIGGFQSWSVPRGQPAGELGWVDDPGLLTGSAGVGLCLLAAVTGQQPEWDRALAISG